MFHGFGGSWVLHGKNVLSNTAPVWCLIESLKNEEKMIKSNEIDRRRLDMCLDSTLGCSVISSLKFHIILSN